MEPASIQYKIFLVLCILVFAVGLAIHIVGDEDFSKQERRGRARIMLNLLQGRAP